MNVFRLVKSDCLMTFRPKKLLRFIAIWLHSCTQPFITHCSCIVKEFWSLISYIFKNPIWNSPEQKKKNKCCGYRDLHPVQSHKKDEKSKESCDGTGLIAAYIQLWRGTKYSRFPKWLDDWLKMRKQLGLLMLGLAGMHVSSHNFFVSNFYT